MFWNVDNQIRYSWYSFVMLHQAKISSFHKHEVAWKRQKAFVCYRNNSWLIDRAMFTTGYDMRTITSRSPVHTHTHTCVFSIRQMISQSYYNGQERTLYMHVKTRYTVYAPGSWSSLIFIQGTKNDNFLFERNMDIIQGSIAPAG